jgi:hypothetical protein
MQPSAVASGRGGASVGGGTGGTPPRRLAADRGVVGVKDVEAALFGHEDPPVLGEVDGGGVGQAAEDNRFFKTRRQRRHSVRLGGGQQGTKGCGDQATAATTAAIETILTRRLTMP